MNQEKDELIVGIDLGTTNSLVSVVDSGFPIVLADSDGRRVIPSVVGFQDDGTVLVGEAAERSRALLPDSTVSSIKRIIGRRYSDLSVQEISELPFRIEPASDGGILVRIGNSAVKTPEQISSCILSHLKQLAETALETEVKRAVVTVPAYFGHSQREATRKSAELAGWTVERILNEPTAAALTYGLDQSEEAQMIAVYDLGGGTFDLSILEVKDGVFEVIATAGDTCLGGDDIDLAILNWVIETADIDESSLDSGQRTRILTEVRKAKESLSEDDDFSIELPFFDGNKSLEVVLSRDQLEQLALPIVEKTRSICQRAFLEGAHKNSKPIDHFILVGGSTRMPLIRQKLEEWFEMQPNLNQHPDEAIAIGAGIQAGIMCGRVKQVVLLDVVPLSLGIETIGGLMNVIIPRNTTIPAKAGELFTNGVSDQESMAVRILQGERELAKDNWMLGEITVPFGSGPKGSARVGVQFEIDENGILTVLTRDTKTDKDLVLTIESAAIDVNDEAVEKMVSESIEFAFDDMNNRVLTETRMKSAELLPAVDSALSLVGDQIEGQEKQSILEAASNVRSLFEMENPPLDELKSANALLDEKTQNLAAILVEIAMDQAFDG